MINVLYYNYNILNFQKINDNKFNFKLYYKKIYIFYFIPPQKSNESLS